MIPGPFFELYVSTQLEDLDACRHQQDAVSRKTPIWAQWVARLLVQLASGIGGEQVRIDWPAARV